MCSPFPLTIRSGAWPQERADPSSRHCRSRVGTAVGGTGSQGERCRWACSGALRERAGTAHWLLARRSLSDPTEVAYYRVFAPTDTPIAEMVRVAGMRWAIEASFEDARVPWGSTL